LAREKVKIDRLGMTRTEFNFDDSSKIKIDLIIENDSTEIFFDLTYFEKSFFRVDTVEIYRLDTLKIETEKIVKEEIHFYEKFWFGALVAATLAILILAK
jgi:hypothetical protein